MVSIRKATLTDFDFFYEIKCEETNIFWTGHLEKPEKDNLFSFFESAIKDAMNYNSRKIYIVEDDMNKIGYLYIIPSNESFELSSAISHKYQKKGYGKKAIMLGLEEGKKMGFKRMVSSIREDNIASLKAYTACGVVVTDEYRNVYIPRLDKEVKMYIVKKELN